ncbi:5-oxoprolinase subunit PxpB [Algoriphagus halophytocola]|uniref:5-oxoprolinase subunit PxpB n=1 Tax=Algoriphagus halophytocola TaxID=2991499 RepID=A0ABY6MLG8_9BACT|nr:MULTISPECIES: 5-oxoprolinase subunit PxpB [unclassified Algoriphagus]UZD23126.1 5-oxoprolinase subunit PxpB [Algoriphagus sp. TR-M5]WBL44418.1 5-oxoprolinase subunit PxpB [Algoriphagus sp. TR-M9]
MKPKIREISPRLLEAKWDLPINDTLLQQQLALKKQLQEHFLQEKVEIRQGFDSLCIMLDRPAASPSIVQFISSLPPVEKVPDLPEKTWKIPVCYSLETGRDLHALAASKNISPDELIHIHSTAIYRIHFFGFLPGFMYLHGLSELLFTPRKKTPDLKVPKGAVAIGGSQTGIYPCESPGGWHLIGQTPIELFNPKFKIPIFAEVGERIEFTPISFQDFERLKRHPKQPNFR